MGEMIVSAIQYGGIAAILGALGGVGEVFLRHPRAPFHLLVTRPAIFYLIINAVVSIAALVLIHAFGWMPAVSPAIDVNVVQAVVAGVGGIIFLRSTLTIRASEYNLAIGLSQYLDRFFRAAEGEMERQETKDSMRSTLDIMKGVSFRKAYNKLPKFCIENYSRHASEEKKEKLKADLKSIEMEMALYYRTGGPDVPRLIILGERLLEVVGEDVLRQAIAMYGNSIKVKSKVKSPSSSYEAFSSQGVEVSPPTPRQQSLR